MVVIKEDNLLSNKWRLCRIDSVFPEADGNVRVVSILTARRIIKRALRRELSQWRKRKTCNGKHHTLLRRYKRPLPSANQQRSRRQDPPTRRALDSPPRSASSTPAPSLASILKRHSVNVLPTAMVTLETGMKKFDTAALINPCTPTSCIDASLSSAFRLPTTTVGDERICTATIQSKRDDGGIYLRRIEPSLTSIAMRSVTQQRGFCKSQITRAHNNATKFVEDIQSIQTLVARLAQLQENYLRFVKLTEELHAFESEEGWENPEEDFDVYEEKHYATYAVLSNTLEELKAEVAETPLLVPDQSLNTSHRSHVDFQFERIKLPTFSGNYEDWKHFSDMFTASIASHSGLTDCQRFHYLKSYLSGEALTLVKHIPVTNENYSEAWDRLEKRYNKQSLIMRSFLNSFLTLPSANTTSIGAVRKLADGADEMSGTGTYQEPLSVNHSNLPSTSRAGALTSINQLRHQEDPPSGNVPSVENNYTHHTLENIPVAGLQTLLPTILADVIDAWGNTTTCRMLLDTGSTITLASESFVQRIGVHRTHARISILGLAANNAGLTRGRAHFKLRSRHSDHHIEMVSFILPSLTSSLPAQAIDTSSTTWKQISALPLADPTFCTPGSIDVIVGSDQLWGLYTGERKYFGSYNACDDHITPAVTHHADLDRMVRSFMEMDSVQCVQALLDSSDPTESNFARTHTRSKDGVYIVEFPFKGEAPPIESTLPQATNRLVSLERKFRRHPDLKQQYEDFLDDYLQRGHMEQLTSVQAGESLDTCVYLPHHAVIKVDSLTTKCRVVFDGSGKVSSGISLNDRLHVGPPIQRDLLGVCLRFRQHRYVLCADIKKMFRGIQVAKPHTNFQRIVWRKNEKEPILRFRLLTVTYGLAPSPFLAFRVLKQLADDHCLEYPAASRALSNDAYVDDIPTGCDTVDDLLLLKQELIGLLDKAKFKLRKWSSNCWQLLQSLPQGDRCYDPVQLSKDSPMGPHVKILGLQWNPGRDVMFIKTTEFDLNVIPTKR
ncbi:uncharacterized protein [Drosophila takahashii]|uniref:uncharacterized protein n=1 Tax=Drosophila takahashii TaxID=29030 RepID=UPI00389968E1